MKTFVLVADGGEARLLRVLGRGDARVLKEVERFDNPSARVAARDLTSDLTGRVFSSAGRGPRGQPTSIRHGADSDFDPHAEKVLRFARRLSRKLDVLRRAGESDEFLVAAAPHFLGVLRQVMSRPTRAIVTHELDRDLVHSKEAQVAKALFSAGRNR